MKEMYLGKSCPYCNIPLKEGDEIVSCNICDTPHHLSCWQENSGCAMSECNGKVVGSTADNVIKGAFASEQAKTEHEERIRLAEEQVKLDQEKIKEEIKRVDDEKKRKKRRKKVICISIISFVFVVSITLGTVFFVIPYYKYKVACKSLDNGEYDIAYQAFLDLYDFMDSADMANKALYQKAESLLNNKEYDTAYQMFSDLGNFMDSADMANKVLYQKAESALNNKEYDSAIQTYEQLGDYEDSQEKILEAKYQKADNYQNEKNYKDAYQLYVELGDYKDSKDEVLVTILLWEAEALGSGSTTLAYSFSRTVELNYSQYEMFYSTILLFLNGHDNAEYWFDWGATSASENVKTMLEMLPSYYKDTSTLLELFNHLTSYSALFDLFRDNKTLVQQCWPLSFVQDLAEQDMYICYFLKGFWNTSDWMYYISFYADDDGSASCEYELPSVAKPSGTKYFDINSLTYVWEDKNGNELAKVFRFEIVDYDTINVYCYKNNRTYTLYRE